jgi:hypothetical protein
LREQFQTGKLHCSRLAAAEFSVACRLPHARIATEKYDHFIAADAAFQESGLLLLMRVDEPICMHCWCISIYVTICTLDRLHFKPKALLVS